MGESRRKLERESKDLVKEIGELTVQVKSDQRTLCLKQNRLTEITQLLTAETSSGPTVSDHAIVRYLEAKGFDIKGIRNEILTPTTAAAIKAGAQKVTVGNMRFMVKDQIITTVIR